MTGDRYSFPGSVFGITAVDRVMCVQTDVYFSNIVGPGTEFHRAFLGVKRIIFHMNFAR